MTAQIMCLRIQRSTRATQGRTLFPYRRSSDQTKEILENLIRVYISQKIAENNNMKISDKETVSNHPEELNTDIDFLEIDVVISMLK